MADAVPLRSKDPRDSPVSDVHIVWMTAGLGCDGDSVSITAATQPSIEDVILGAIPGLPKVHLHNPVLAYENGDEFLSFWHRAAEGKLNPFVLVVEGSIPNEKIKKEEIGPHSARTPKPDNRLPPMNGSIAWLLRRLLSSRAAPAPPTAEFTPWLATRRAQWGSPIILVGVGNQWPVCRSSTFRAVQFNRTISWKLSFTFSTRLLDSLP